MDFRIIFSIFKIIDYKSTDYKSRFFETRCIGAVVGDSASPFLKKGLARKGGDDSAAVSRSGSETSPPSYHIFSNVPKNFKTV
jgi:hypothetical protein